MSALNTRGERMLNDFWTDAERIGALFGSVAIERPAKVETAARPLSSKWSDCPICSANVNACQCDPDDYADALLARMRAS